MAQSKLTLSRRQIEALQNDVRRAINYRQPGGDLNEGVDPTDLKRFIGYVVGNDQLAHISLRKAPASESGLVHWLSYDGELLFRLVWVPWPDDFAGAFGRWHVRRHPDASWWRDAPKPRPG